MNSRENNTVLEMEELNKKVDVAQNKLDDFRKQREFLSNNHEIKMNELKVSYSQLNTT